MTLKANRLYLITARYQTIAIIPSEDPLKAISKYLAKIGFDSIHKYFYNYLMTTTIAVDTKIDDIGKYYFATVDATTTSSGTLSISAEWIVSYGDIFGMIDYADINNPLFIRPTIEEVRNCIGFSRAVIRELRKFCR